MKMLTDPRWVDPKQGSTWLKQGFKIFHQQPLAWTLILFIYWAAMLMMAFIPLFGMVLPLLLSPGLALGFLEVAKAVDEKRPPSPPLLISAFRSAQTKSVILLGSWYLLEILAVMLVTFVIDGGQLIQWITRGVMPAEDQMATVRFAAAVGLLLYFPVMMCFWFAPQLVVWQGFTPLKALFFSFFAVWRNRGAFIRYLITWIGLVIFLAAVITLISQALGMAAESMSAILFPVTLILMAVAHGSFYASTKAVFGTSENDSAPGPFTPDQA
jgi:hypothetical protein